MSSFSVEAIVLRRADYRENDRMLTLLTPGGRIDALARGCKRPKSPLLPASEAFTLGNFELVRTGTHFLVASCMITDSFYPLRLDYDKLFCAACMTNVCEAAVQPEENAQKIFLLLARALGCLCYKDISPRTVLGVFLLHSSIAFGYRPRLHHCVSCGREVPATAPALFDLEEGGVLCDDCAPNLSRGGVLTLKERLWLDEARAHGVHGNLDENALPLPFLQAYIETRLEKHIFPSA